MKNHLNKLGQTAPQPPSNPPQVRESSFTEADFATAIHTFLKGMDEFAKIGMVSTDFPSLVSGTLDIVNRFLTASPASNYLEREIGIGVRQLQSGRDKSSDIIEDIKRSFSQRVSSKIGNAFDYFTPLINYSLELLGNTNITPDMARVKIYEEKKQEIGRTRNNLGSKTSLNSNLSFLISEVKESVNIIKQKSGTNFSILNQVLNLDSASETGLDIDQDTLSDKKFDLDNVPNNLKNQLSILLKELLTLQALVSAIKGVGSHLSQTRAVPISGSRPATSPGSGPTTTVGGAPTGGNSSPLSGGSSPATIIGIVSTDFVADSANSYKLINVTTASNPSLILKVRFSNRSSLQPYDLFSILYRSRLISIENGSGLSNPPQEVLDQLQKISEIVSNPNSNNVFLELSLDRNNGVYNLKISILNSIAKKLNRYPGINIFKFTANNRSYIVKSGKNKFLYNSGISDITFDINDLINNSSNISKTDKQKILNKLKNE